MKVLLYGRNGTYPSEIEEMVRSVGLEIIPSDPETVVCFGGDGTLLGSERDYPGIPKLLLKNSPTCVKCSNLPNEELLKLLVENKLKIKEFSKIECSYNEKKFLAINDVVIRNEIPNIALRFSINIPLPLSSNSPVLIGDGLILCTPFGSSGYYYSIAQKTFGTGIGLAFNNLHNTNLPPIILPNETELEVEIIRGPADLAIDNDPEIIKLGDGEKILVHFSPEKTKILIS